MITADQLKDVMDRAEALHRYLNIDQKKVEFEEEQLRTQAPDFWEDTLQSRRFKEYRLFTKCRCSNFNKS